MQKLVIDSEKKGLNLNLKELFHYKDLFLILAYRDFKVRYAQTFLGFVWAFLQPITTLIIFTLVFGRFVKIDTGDIPYPLFALTGMVAWTYFAFVMSNAGGSIIDASNMVKKIYFPRLIIPLSKAVVGLADFIISFILLIVMMIWYNHPPSFNIIYLPFFVFLVILSSLGVGIWLSALSIRYRDIRLVIPFLVQIGMYASPIAFPISLIDEKLRPFFYANPLTGIIEGFRWCLFGGAPPNSYFYISVFVIILVFVSSLYYFKKVERVIADIV